MSRAAEVMKLAATVTYTKSGTTSLLAARERPRAPILGLTPTMEIARRLSVAWGVHAVSTGESLLSVEGIVDQACAIGAREGIARAGDDILITAGVPVSEPGTTNLLRIARLPSPTV